MTGTPTQGTPECQFSERDFYGREFRGRSLAIAVADPAQLESVRGAVEELVRVGSRAVLMATRRDVLGKLVGGPVVESGTQGLEGAIWRALRADRRAGISVASPRPFAEVCCDLAVGLGLFKLVWIDRQGGLSGPGDERLSFVDRAELSRLLEAGSPSHPRARLCRDVAAMLDAGIPAVNVCTAEGLADELFTYAGTGTLFTRERYITVRRLGVDDYDAAWNLLRRGVEEGYLLPRSDVEVESILAHGLGAFVEGSHLAGIGALVVHPEARMGEIASLYTLTRFLGEGVGAHLVKRAVERAATLGLRLVFACTTSERVEAFFRRQGFEPMDPEAMPSEKWQGYPAERRAQLRCLARPPTSPG